MLLLTIKPDNLGRPMLARGLEDAPAVLLQNGLCRVVVQPGIGQRRRDVGVTQGFLDPVQVDAILREPASDRPAQIVQPHILDAGGLAYLAPGPVDVDQMPSLLL